MDISRHPSRTLTGKHPVIHRIVRSVRICLRSVSQYLNLTNGTCHTVQCSVKGIQNMLAFIKKNSTIPIKEDIITKLINV